MSNYNDLDDDLWDVDNELKRLESNMPPKNTKPEGESSTNYLMILIVGVSVLTGFIIGGMVYNNSSKTNSPYVTPESEIQIKFTNNKYKKELLQKIRDSKTSVIWVTSSPENPKIIKAIEHAKEDGATAFILTDKKISKDTTKYLNFAGINISTPSSPLPDNCSIFILDRNLLIDMTNNGWSYEITDQDIISKISDWLLEKIEDENIFKAIPKPTRYEEEIELTFD